jgi:hypothetical protein
MNDPHVETLVYQLKTASNVHYENAQPIDVDYEEYSGRLESNQLICEMKMHYPHIDAARSVVEASLRAWEVDVALRFGRGELEFVYMKAKVIDRNPSPPGSPQKSQISGRGQITASGHASIGVVRRQYPHPSMLFRISPDVETLWKRYEMYLDKKEPICSMAYFCLTVIEVKAGGKPEARRKASRIFSIDKEVLDKLGELTSIRGDSLTARKAALGSTPSPLSDKENKWIEAVIKQLIHRMGENWSDRKLPVIKMSELPPLDPQ